MICIKQQCDVREVALLGVTALQLCPLRIRLIAAHTDTVEHGLPQLAYLRMTMFDGRVDGVTNRQKLRALRERGVSGVVPMASVRRTGLLDCPARWPSGPDTPTPPSEA